MRFCNICLSFSKNSLCSRDFTKVFAAHDIIVITIIYKNKTHESIDKFFPEPTDNKYVLSTHNIGKKINIF